MASLGLLLCVLALLLCGPLRPGLSRPQQRGPKKPIIGILMQRCRTKEMRNLGKYYIAASYVKYLESAGARVVPIRLDLQHTQYTELFRSINGILFPGGSASILHSEYSQVARIFYNKAIENFTENAKLKKVFNILTTNTDGNIEFISSMEGMCHYRA
ncbi:hypothetical protein U0070_009302 [Myodes glareolus]|uniref:folate gamma-glutamyl hydrolase n=1 Tax=Myodes glareolus TaxID=447135 RepID=A0AAW0I092_MYOGA